MTYRGYVKNGAIQLDEPIALREGAAVDVTVLKPMAPAGHAPKGSSLEERLSAIWADVLASEWTKLPYDLSYHLDHYIYGTPKQ